MRVMTRVVLRFAVAAAVTSITLSDVVEVRRESPPAAPSTEWLSQVETAIGQAEYRFAPAGQRAFAAPNRAHDLRIHADSNRLILTSRQATAGSSTAWELSMRLARWGRDGRLAPAEQRDPENVGARLEYRRSGLTEWYVNDEHGFEQGFELPRPPAAPSAGDPLILEMEISSTLGAFPNLGGDEVLFKDSTLAVVLRCGGLKVVDASGAAIPARFDVRPRALRFVIDDSEAIYPITVDPLFTTVTWSLLGGQTQAILGKNAVTAGDVNKDGYSDVIVSAHNYDNGETDEGRLYLYLGSSSGLSTTPAWIAEGNQASALFGWAAGPAGDVNGDGFADVVVSAVQYDNGETDEGVVFIYHGGLSGLQATPARMLEINLPLARFGHSVSTAGDVNGDGYSDIIVGAYQFSNGQTGEGEVLVYLGGPSGVAATPAWQAESNSANAHLGVAVGAAGDINGDGYDDVIAGANGWTNGSTNEGAAFVWLGGPSGPGSTPAWQTEPNSASASFGSSVAGAGDVNGDGYADVIVGAPGYGTSLFRPGRAFLYLGSPSGPQLPAAWFMVGANHNARMGSSVGTAGDANSDGFADVLVGSSGWADIFTDQGAAYLFLGSAAGLPATENWFVTGDPNARMGSSVGTAGDVDGDGHSEILVSSQTETQTFVSEGLVLLYRGTPDGLSTSPVWTSESNQTSAQFGFGLSAAGDVNGDGFTDMIVGCPTCDSGETDEGMAFLFPGGPSGLAASPSWTAQSNQIGAQFGDSVAGAGDVNGDGYSDVVVGAWLYDNGQQNEGAAFVYLGGPSGLQNSAAWVGEGNQASASYGFSVAGAGDVNGDGFGDIAIGAPDMDNGQAEEGMAFLYLGSSTGPQSTPNWISEGDQAGAAHGYSVAAAGDMNQDGYSDLLVGEPGYDYNGRVDSGRVSVYKGASFGLLPLSVWDLVIWSPGANLGREVATAGDVNGDGYSDIIVGAPFDDYAGSDAGTALVLYGSAQLYNSGVTFLDGAAGWYFGASVSTAGDINGDGYSDVIVGGYAFTSIITPITSEGLAQVYLGSSSGIMTSPTWGATGGQTLGFFGRRVRFAGDINGDGFSDIIVGAPNNANGQTYEGMVYAWYGNGIDGLHIALQQRTTTNSAVVSPLGWSDDDDGIGLNVRARTPAGRGRVRVETEIKNLSIAFNGLGTWLSGWSDTGAPVAGDGSAAVVHQVCQPISNTPSRMLRWRTRFVSSSPFFPHSRWYWLWANAPSEGDIWLASCRDADGDGYGSPAWSGCAGGALPDCNDGSAAVHPGASEICDGLDNDCNTLVDDFPAPGPPELSMNLGGVVSWVSPPGASSVDIVRGNLNMLLQTNGDFTVSTAACLANNSTSGSLVDLPNPLVGKAFWYLARGTACVTPGSYDEGVASQIGTRDAEIAATANSCP